MTRCKHRCIPGAKNSTLAHLALCAVHSLARPMAVRTKCNKSNEMPRPPPRVTHVPAAVPATRTCRRLLSLRTSLRAQRHSTHLNSSHLSLSANRNRCHNNPSATEATLPTRAGARTGATTSAQPSERLSPEATRGLRPTLPARLIDMADLFEHRQRIPPWGTLARSPLQTASTRWCTLRELLEDTFEKMRPKWARDFLFHPDSLVDAQIMSSPLQKSHAIAMQMTGAFQELEQCAMQSRDNLAVHALLIPAYSVGNISAGYVVECYNGATRPEELFSRNKRLIRCLRNDLNGSTSCASLDELADEVEIGCNFTESTVNSMRAFLRFDRAAFFQSFNMHTGHVDYVGLQNALRISVIGTSISRCILCSAPLFFSCKCKINFKPAKHPLSFENNALYSLPFLGDFHDLYTITNFEQPTATSVTSSSTSCTSPATIPTSRIYQAYSSSISGTPFGVAERLHKWAVTTLMCQQKPNPLHLTFPHVAVPSSPFIQRKQADFPALLTSASGTLLAAPELFSNPPEPPDLGDIFEYSNAAACGNSHHHHHHHHHHHNQNNNNHSVSNTNNNIHSSSIVVPISLPSESDTNYFESKMAEAESDELLSETPPSDFATSTVTSELFSHSASSSSPPADIEDPIPTDLSTFPVPPQPASASASASAPASAPAPAPAPASAPAPAPAPAPTPTEQQPTPTPTPTPPPLSSPAILPQLLPQVVALPSLASAAAVATASASAIKQSPAARHVPKPIAPAPLQCRQQGAGGLINAPLTEGTAYLAKLERDRLARLEARKIRKREAAARSNARRSQRRLEERQKKAAAVSQ